ncbi:hypothetical protein pb186bvf_011820 [Paramecium bursaria]
MQSYKLHIVSEQLKDRHPYVEPEFKQRYDPSEVYHAVFDRSIPKLIEILLMPNIESFKYRDSLITLNEMVDHQEYKDQMITQGLVGIASAYLHHKDLEIRKQAVILLGCLLSLKRGREQLVDLSFEGLAKLLFDDARDDCGWALCRIISGRDGVDILCRSNLTKVMIEAFMQSDGHFKFQVYLLEAFSKISEYDNGIFFFLRCGIIQRFIHILDNDYGGEHRPRINYLCLDVLAKICANHDGKIEAIRENAIRTASSQLDSPHEKEQYFATVLIMNCAINLDGKKQCVHVTNDEIIQKLINLLDKPFSDDVRQALKNIADYPDGFYIITRLLVDRVQDLADLFDTRVIISLSYLIPRNAQDYTQYKPYAKTLCRFLREYEKTIQVAIEETVKIHEKLINFFYYPEMAADIADILKKISQEDQDCKEFLKAHFLNYKQQGNQIDKIQKMLYNELLKYEFAS